MDADRCGTDAQTCKGCMTKLAIVAAVATGARGPTSTTFVSPEASELGEMNVIVYYAGELTAGACSEPRRGRQRTSVREHLIAKLKVVMSHRA